MKTIICHYKFTLDVSLNVIPMALGRHMAYMKPQATYFKEVLCSDQDSAKKLYLALGESLLLKIASLQSTSLTILKEVFATWASKK